MVLVGLTFNNSIQVNTKEVHELSELARTDRFVGPLFSFITKSVFSHRSTWVIEDVNDNEGGSKKGRGSRELRKLNEYFNSYVKGMIITAFLHYVLYGYFCWAPSLVKGGKELGKDVKMIMKPILLNRQRYSLHAEKINEIDVEWLAKLNNQWGRESKVDIKVHVDPLYGPDETTGLHRCRLSNCTKYRRFVENLQKCYANASVSNAYPIPITQNVPGTGVDALPQNNRLFADNDYMDKENGIYITAYHQKLRVNTAIKNKDAIDFDPVQMTTHGDADREDLEKGIWKRREMAAAGTEISPHQLPVSKAPDDVIDHEDSRGESICAAMGISASFVLGNRFKKGVSTSRVDEGDTEQTNLSLIAYQDVAVSISNYVMNQLVDDYTFSDKYIVVMNSNLGITMAGILELMKCGLVGRKRSQEITQSKINVDLGPLPSWDDVAALSGGGNNKEKRIKLDK